LYPLLFSLCSVIAVFGLVWFMVRTAGKTDAVAEGETDAVKKPNAAALLGVFLVIGFLLRLIFVFAVKGYRAEVNAFTDLFAYVKANGFGKRYYASQGMGVFPLTYYIYAFMGLFFNAFSLTADSVFAALFVKLPLIAADLITAFLLYKTARKYLNAAAAVGIAAFVCVCPLFVFASGVWGSVYSLVMLFAVLTLYFLVEKNFIATIGCYAAALLCHKSALCLFPAIAVFVIYNLVKASMTVHAAKNVTFGQVLADKEMRPVFTVPVAIVGFAIVSYLVALPVMIGSYGAGYFTFLYRIYLKPLASFTVFGHNSLGIFNLFLRNGKGLNARFPSIVFTVLFAVIVTAIVLLVYLSKKNRANLVFLCGYILFTLATYFVGYEEFSLLAVTAICLLSFLLIRDKRILSVAGMLILLITVNASAVMASAGYYNNSVAYDFTAEAGYAGTEILQGGAQAVTIVCSALAVLTHLYATVVLLDISMSNKRKVLPYIENATFGTAMRSFFARTAK
ncbi:MAG: hypothetical protein K2L51_06935, partial [Clostridiales bacterium]|nr:hypothetical protein [Clostridiales bacterium]